MVIRIITSVRVFTLCDDRKRVRRGIWGATPPWS